MNTVETEKFKMLNPNLLSTLYNMGQQGDLKAAKLFFDRTDAPEKNNTANQNYTETGLVRVIENQHNYIQVNQTRLSQEEIQKLPPERLKQIEELLRLPEKAA
jgi:hypothetical protein